MVGKRHGSEEIAEKLVQADELAAAGKNQHDIAKALGISVMTYHRWRKVRLPAARGIGDRRRATAMPPAPAEEAISTQGSAIRPRRLQDLEQENTRLRRLVTDLLLEKVGLEEVLREHQVHLNRRTRRD